MCRAPIPDATGYGSTPAGYEEWAGTAEPAASLRRSVMADKGVLQGASGLCVSLALAALLIGCGQSAPPSPKPKPQGDSGQAPQDGKAPNEPAVTVIVPEDFLREWKANDLAAFTKYSGKL